MKRFLVATFSAAGLLLASCASTSNGIDPRQEAHLLLAADDSAGAADLIDTHGDLSDPATVLLRAEAAFRNGNYDSAVKHYEAALAIGLVESVRRFALSNLANAQRAAGNPAAAYATLQTLRDEAGASDDLEYQMGVCCVANANIAKAREHFANLPEEQRARLAAVLGNAYIYVSQN